MTEQKHYPDFKVQPWQFLQRQKLPLWAKLKLTKQRIRAWYDHWGGDVYVSFSGGKDSTALLHLVREEFPDVPAVFVDTGLEYPEIRDFVKQTDNVIWLRPKLSFKKVLEKYGYPVISKSIAQGIHEVHHARDPNGALTKLRLTGIGPKGNYRPSSMISKKWQFLLDAPFAVSHRCCDILKKNPVKKYEKESGLKPYIGTLAEESKLREKQYLKNGCNGFSMRRPVSNPMAFWTDGDVLTYIRDEHLPLASVYGKIVEAGRALKLSGVPRTGCIFCCFGVQYEKEPNKFQRLKRTHPHLHNYCLEKLDLRTVLDYIGVPYE